MPRDPAASDPRFPGWTREGEFLYRRRQHFPGRIAADLHEEREGRIIL